MPGSKPNDHSEIPNTRVGRLLRERTLRRSRIPDGTEIADGDEPSYEGGVPVPNEGLERPTKQRLLVVANRLPVSAVRRAEDSWSLEISAGGLVSALLGLLLISASFSFQFALEV